MTHIDAVEPAIRARAWTSQYETRSVGEPSAMALILVNRREEGPRAVPLEAERELAKILRAIKAIR